ncbi:decarboxylase [Streptomyces sp. NBRC 110611]|uniref:diaminopimelate decarboxylase n=1 Tax=Streptomyces sp. NBRC 110611 TaxID=1621259 RepID=UPI00082F3514|nr:diaminopimelate decarboxylase [Streptomyces sp. NBRC 110611]GAU66533.1 decarboxylase [Streptomyces sp. NBRC 110611]
MKAAPPHPESLRLEPQLEPPLASLLRAPAFLHSLVDALGSPLNVVLPERLAENVERFRAVHRRHSLSGQVFFAHKANRSSALVRRLAATGAGIDVASLGELQHALGAGFAPDRIVATGPKDPEFRWLAALSGVTVGVDGQGELAELAALVRGRGLARLRVLLRLSGFEAASGITVRSRQSRFGTSVKALDGLLDELERHKDVVEPVGVAYHLDTTSLDEKAIALEGCLRAMDALRRRWGDRPGPSGHAGKGGARAWAVDIGGGFGANYLADADDWDRYTTALTHAVLGRRPPLTWRGHGYGLRVENGTLRGALSLYPAHRPLSGAAYLDALLSRPAAALGGRPLGTLLLENLYDLYSEPGRALVDQCGLSLARVLEVRRTEAGERIVRLAMTAGDVALEEHGVLMDPVLVPRDGTPPDAAHAGPDVEPSAVEPSAVYLTGSLCLEADLITRRTVFLARLPRPGDLLAFANTAGYCMDFSATSAQRQPVARKAAAWEEGGSWRWCLDEQYWPISPSGGLQA